MNTIFHGLFKIGNGGGGEKKNEKKSMEKFAKITGVLIGREAKYGRVHGLFEDFASLLYIFERS